MANFDFLKNFLGKSAKPTKNMFDCSHADYYSVPFGTITPVSSMFVVPNEDIQVNVGGYVQTAPMREDNFMDIYNNMKAVFVPMSSLSRDYLPLITNNTQRLTRSDDLVSSLNRYDVRFSLRFLLGFSCMMLIPVRVCEMILSVPNYDRYVYSSNSSDFVYTDSDELVKLSEAVPFGANLKDMLFAITFIAGKQGLVDRLPLASYLNCLDDLRITSSGEYWSYDVLRILDALGYGNYYPFFERCLKDLFVSADTSSQYVPSFYDTYDLFQFNFVSVNSLPKVLFAGTFSKFRSYCLQYFSVPVDSVSLLPVLAYQFYISTCERSNYRNPSTSVHSLDGLFNYLTFCERSADYPYYSSLGNIFDLFSSVLDPNSLESWNGNIDSDFFISYINGFLDNDVDLTNYYLGYAHEGEFEFYYLFKMFSLSSELLEKDMFTTAQLSKISGNVPTVTSTNFNSNPVEAMASAKALYKLRQDLMRSGVQRNKQMEALFGVSGNQHTYEPCRILDQTRSQVNIQSLISTAETAEAPLGARAAKGNGKGSLSFRFHTEDYGFVFFVQSFTCRQVYENVMIQRQNSLLMSSWWLPQNNNLGLEALDSSQLCFVGGSNRFDVISPNNVIVGFTSRDAYLKTAVDKVHGAFTNIPIDYTDYQLLNSDYFNPNLDVEKQTNKLRFGNAYYGGYVSTILEQQKHVFGDPEDMYFSTYMVNNIFDQLVDGVVYGGYAFDHFRCATQFDIKRISPLSKIGLLNLN